MKFKTNAKCGGCSSAILKALAPIAPASDWEIDLASADRVLTYKGSADINADDVIKAVTGAGFQCSLL